MVRQFRWDAHPKTLLGSIDDSTEYQHRDHRSLSTTSLHAFGLSSFSRPSSNRSQRMNPIFDDWPLLFLSLIAYSAFTSQRGGQDEPDTQLMQQCKGWAACWTDHRPYSPLKLQRSHALPFDFHWSKNPAAFCWVVVCSCIFKVSGSSSPRRASMISHVLHVTV